MLPPILKVVNENVRKTHGANKLSASNILQLIDNLSVHNTDTFYKSYLVKSKPYILQLTVLPNTLTNAKDICEPELRFNMYDKNYICVNIVNPCYSNAETILIVYDNDKALVKFNKLEDDAPKFHELIFRIKFKTSFEITLPNICVGVQIPNVDINYSEDINLIYGIFNFNSEVVLPFKNGTIRLIPYIGDIIS